MNLTEPRRTGPAASDRPAIVLPVDPEANVAVQPGFSGGLLEEPATDLVTPTTTAPVKLPAVLPVKPAAATATATAKPGSLRDNITAASEETLPLEPGPAGPVRPAGAGPAKPAVFTPKTPLYFAPKHPLGPDGKPSKDYREVITIDPNTKVTVSPNRPNADRPAGGWIPGRATFYGSSRAIEKAYEAAGIGEPGMWGVIEDGSCGFTELEGANGKNLPYPIDMYAAAADSNIDYAGSCGRCYQV
jgi:hypothetical protein